MKTLKEFYRLFKDENITKIVTIEASGIGIACIAAQYFNVPVVLPEAFFKVSSFSSKSVFKTSVEDKISAKQDRGDYALREEIPDKVSELEIGDYLVHDHHGIGIYKGIETMLNNNIHRDYIKLEYKDGTLNILIILSLFLYSSLYSFI